VVPEGEGITGFCLKESSLIKQEIIGRWQTVRQNIGPCSPPVWARGGHQQTILGHLLSSPLLNEKGQALDITLEPVSERIRSTYLPGTSSTVVYLFHGLGGSSEADYMVRTALLARELGHHVFLNNHRGCGEGVGLATEPYHSGKAEDLSAVIAYGRKLLPQHFHLAIGFSLSANALLLLAAGQRASVLPDAAMAVNGPIDLERASLNLCRGPSWIYNLRFVMELKRYVKNNVQSEYQRLQGVWDLRTFDEAYTAPLGGFRDRADYYARCSARQFLGQLRIPTLLLSSQDDPIVGPLDLSPFENAPYLVTHLEQHGGHMGYLSAQGKVYRRWLDHALKVYLMALTDITSPTLR
jgi:uncharacterized protein